MKDKPISYVYFSISGTDLDSTQFIEGLKLIPNNVGENRQGEKFLEYIVNAKDSNEGIDQAIRTLVQKLIPKAKDIRKYSSQRDLYTKMFVVINNKSANDSGVFLGKEVIQFLFDTNSDIEVDVYN